MAEAFLVDVVRSGLRGPPTNLRYAAMADSPDHALSAVRPLLGDGANLRCTGETLSPSAARALGLRRGHARLV